jgi:hypothetical protein
MSFPRVCLRGRFGLGVAIPPDQVSSRLRGKGGLPVTLLTHRRNCEGLTCRRDHLRPPEMMVRRAVVARPRVIDPHDSSATTAA